MFNAEENKKGEGEVGNYLEKENEWCYRPTD